MSSTVPVVRPVGSAGPTERQATDRRAALKDRHRRAIVAAAAALMEEADGVRFTVDQLAERADVARRTVFNHFASLDEVVAAVSADVLDPVLDALVAGMTSAPTGDAASMFDDLAAVLRATDLVTPMAWLTRALGPVEDESPVRAGLLLRGFSDLGERMTAALAARHPDADALDVHLLVGSLMSGLVVLHRHWWAATAAADDDASRRTWADLLERLLDTVRTGYRAGPPAP
ncbi:TetR/AcrR family transcriptional regulator [Cellulomonas carbonis]|uniref:TetR family transcriptional regulator n=1 Tax=Cellulomonas carbonis T26 TaxID=947969 RepID=A0A0A0BS58_9CELL|nr:TetR/AcrR family transcriptional regulator [Cellulomonas carbonis]KGM11263.1 TetR family transcriptional regulator [Cellulomonas carbonis T26]GGC18143.1 hypothetical protein GCM10010972_34190 [Cellulomonas carbonis]